MRGFLKIQLNTVNQNFKEVDGFTNLVVGNFRSYRNVLPPFHIPIELASNVTSLKIYSVEVRAGVKSRATHLDLDMVAADYVKRVGSNYISYGNDEIGTPMIENCFYEVEFSEGTNTWTSEVFLCTDQDKSVVQAEADVTEEVIEGEEIIEQAEDTGDVAVIAMAEYDGDLYALTDDKVLVYDGVSWATSVDGGYGNVTSGLFYYGSLEVFDGKLFAGTKTGLYEFNGSAWSTTDATKTEITKIKSIGGVLYIFLGDNTKYYTYNGSAFTEETDVPLITDGVNSWWDRVWGAGEIAGNVYAGGWNIVDPSGPTFDRGVYVNSGSGFTLEQNIGTVRGIEADSGVLYAIGEKSIWGTTGSGWTLNNNFGEFVTALAVVSNTRYIGAKNKIYKESGATYTETLYTNLEWITCFGTRGSDIYVGTSNGRIMKIT